MRSTGQVLPAIAHRTLGAQLYTVREQAEHNLPSVLDAIHKIGYQEVETYWDVYGIPASKLSRDPRPWHGGAKRPLQLRRPGVEN